MKRNAFIMKLKKGYETEYKKRHDEIWPELKEELKKAGISDYSIFLDENTGTLFAVQKLTQNNTVVKLPESPIMSKWWNFMADIMDVNRDNSPVCIQIKEVFYMD